jgi:hypothetical protein
MEEHALYEFLPGIRCRRFPSGTEVVIRAYRSVAGGEEAPEDNGALRARTARKEKEHERGFISEGSPIHFIISSTTLLVRRNLFLGGQPERKIDGPGRRSLALTAGVDMEFNAAARLVPQRRRRIWQALF